MKYSKSLLLYEDNPAYGLFFKLIIIGMPATFLIVSIFLWLAEETEGSLVLLAEAFIVGLIFWSVFPRKYQIYKDHLRIVLGGPFSVKVSFEQIKAIEATNTFAFSMNFVTRITKDYILIARKKGMGISITPQDNDSFIENANEAIAQWAKTGSYFGRPVYQWRVYSNNGGSTEQ